MRKLFWGIGLLFAAVALMQYGPIHLLIFRWTAELIGYAGIALIGWALMIWSANRKKSENT